MHYLFEQKRRRLLFSLTLIVVAAAALRLYLLPFQLWLDEIWTVQVAHGLRGLGEALSASIGDGRFGLYTWYLSFLPEEASPTIIRLPAYLAGLLQVLLAYLLARFWWNSRVSLIAALLVAASFFFTVYGTEARGYAPMGAALLGLTLLQEQLIFRTKQSTAFLKGLLLFWALALIAPALHLSFLPYYVALGLYGAVTATNKGIAEVKRWGVLHFIPICGAVWLYLTVLRHLAPGTGPLVGSLDVAVDSLSYFLGGPAVSSASPEQTLTAMLFALFAGGLLITEIRLLLKEHDPKSLLLLLVLIAPVMLASLLHPRVLVPRYFYPSPLIATLFLAHLFSRGFKHTGSLKALAWIGLSLILLFNAAHLLLFVQRGRGDLRAALRAICAEGNPEAVVAGDQSFRDQMILRYYGPKDCPRTQRFSKTRARLFAKDKFRRDPQGG